MRPPSRPLRTHRAGDRGSTLPLILGFFLIALLVVAGSVALSSAFVQQRDLQDTCDGAASAAAASAGDLDRAGGAAAGSSLKFAGVRDVVDSYLRRDPSRQGVDVQVGLSADRERLTLQCTQTVALPLGSFFGHAHVRHRVTSSARAAVAG